MSPILKIVLVALEIAQILTIMLDQIEGVEDCGSSRLTTGQLLES